jgi:hypothetical protein
MLTRSRRRMCKSSEALGDLVHGRLRMEVTRVEWRGTCMDYATHSGLVGWASKPPGGWFRGFGLKTQMKVLRKNGQHVVVSRSLCQGEAISWRARWPSDKEYLGLVYNALGLSGLTQNILGCVWDCVIAVINKDERAPISHTSCHSILPPLSLGFPLPLGSSQEIHWWTNVPV